MTNTIENVYKALRRTYQKALEPGVNTIIITLDDYARPLSISVPVLRNAIRHLLRDGRMRARQTDSPLPLALEAWEIRIVEELAAGEQTAISQFTHAAIVVDPQLGTEIIPTLTEEAALAYLRERAHFWEDRSVLPDLDLTMATLEQLNELYTNGESDGSMVLIGAFEQPYAPPTRIVPQELDWYWREEDGCLVAGVDQRYILLPHPTVTVLEEHKALIAAAPDLLVISEIILSAWQGAQSAEEVHTRIAKIIPDLQAAIAKARNISNSAL